MTIDITKFAADQLQAGQGDGDSNNFSYSGPTGYICSEPNDHPHYTYTATSSDLSSDQFEIADLGCSPGNSETTNDDGETGPLAKSCTSSNTAFSLSGCQPKCATPTLGVQETLNLYDGLDSIQPITRGNDPIEWLPGVSCSAGNFPVQGGCYQTSSGQIYTGATNAQECPPSHYWLEGGGDNPVAAYCSDDPNNLEMKLFGCEPGCIMRNGIPSSESMYLNNESIAASDDPYIAPAQDYNLDPRSLNIPVLCGGGFSDHTSDPSNHTADPCNPEAVTEEDRQYVVSGCFPTCPEGKECISLSNIYNVNDDNERLVKLIPTDYNNYKDVILPGLYGDSLVDSAGVTLPDLTIEEGTSLTAENCLQSHPALRPPGCERILAEQELKDSLYYFRKYKVSETEIGIEAQLRCQSGSEGENVCNLINVGGVDAFIEGVDPFDEQPIPVWRLGNIQEACISVCNGYGGCTSGDWGVSDEGTFRDALTAADLIPNTECAYLDTGAARFTAIPAGQGDPGSNPQINIHESMANTCYYPVAGQQGNCDVRVNSVTKQLCKCNGI